MSSPRLGPATFVVVFALMLLAAPTVIVAPVIPSGKAMVQNNTGEQLTCRYRIAGGTWSEAFALNPAAEFHRPEGDNVQMLCDPPVRRVVYRIKPGERYTMLRTRDGAVAMRRITLDG